MADDQADNSKRTPTRIATDAEALAAAAMEGLDRIGNDLTELRAQVEDLRGVSAGTPVSVPDNLLARLESVEQKVASPTASDPAIWQSLSDLRASIDDQAEALSRLRTSTVEQAKTIPAPGATAAPGVYGKIFAVMQRVSSVGKNGTVKPEAGKRGPTYSFRSIEDVVAAIGQAQRDVGLLILPRVMDQEVSREQVTTSSGYTTVWTTVHVKVQYVMVDPADGSQTVTSMYGEGRDNSDKATSKAMSMALKYALTQAFMVPTEDTSDGDRDHPTIEREQAAPQQARQAPQAPQAPQSAIPNPERALKGLAVVRALQAGRDANGALLSMDEAHNRLKQIEAFATREGLLDEVVDGARFRMHITAALATFEEQQGWPPQAGDEF